MERHGCQLPGKSFLRWYINIGTPMETEVDFDGGKVGRLECKYGWEKLNKREQKNLRKWPWRRELRLTNGHAAEVEGYAFKRRRNGGRVVIEQSCDARNWRVESPFGRIACRIENVSKFQTESKPLKIWVGGQYKGDDLVLKVDSRWVIKVIETCEGVM